MTLASTGSTYDGNAKTITVASVTANGKTFADAATGWYVSYSTIDLTSAGDITVTVTGETNLTGTATATYTIGNASLTSVSVSQSGTLTYNGSPQQAVVSANATAVGGQTVSFTYSTASGGTYSESVPSVGPDADTYTLYYKASAPNHNDVTGSFTVTIGKKSIDTDSVVFGNKSASYTGYELSLTASSVPTGVSVAYEGNARTVPGSQTATVTFSPTDTRNTTVTTDRKSATLTITNASITDVSVEQVGTLTYNKEAQRAKVSASATTQGGQTPTFTYSTSADGAFSPAVPTVGPDVGTYTLFCKASATYHDTSEATPFTITIAKMVINTDSVEFANVEETYTGSEISVTAQNVPDGVIVAYENNASANVVDRQTATLTMSPRDSKNTSVSTAVKTATLTILQATITAVTLVSSESEYDGKAKTISISSVTANGKTFTDAATGWDVSYSRNGSSTTDFASVGAITVTVTGKTNLTGTATASYTIINSTYVITVNPGAGSSSEVTTVEYKSSSSSQTVSFTLPVYDDGHRISAWTALDESGTSVADVSVSGNKITIPANTRKSFAVTPTWVAKTFTVTKSATNCSVNVATSGTYGTALHIAWSPESSTGYKYALTSIKVYSGTSTSGTELASYTSGASADFTMTGAYYESVFVKGVYTKTGISYSVAFDANGGSGTMSTQTGFVYGTDKALTANAFEKTGNSFVEWNTKADGSGDAYADKATMSAGTTTDGGTVTLYAQWKANSYTVSFDGVGGSSPNDKTVTYGAQYGTLSDSSRDDYTFIGWFTEKTGGTQITATSVVSIASNHTLYAHWAKTTQTVTFNSNGGLSPSFSTTTVSYGSAYGLLPTTTRDGYTFAGWYTAQEGGSKVDSSTVVTATVDHTLWAHWATAGKLTLTKSTGISSLFYKIGDETTYTETTRSISFDVTIGLKWYAYAKESEGYSYNGTSSGNPTSGTMTVSGATFAPVGAAKTYNVTSAGTNCTVNVSSSGTFDSELNVSWTPSDAVGYKYTFSSVNVYAGTDATGKLLKSLSGASTSDSFTMSDSYYEAIFVNGEYSRTGISYTVKFDANGGSGTMSAQTGFVYGTEKALTANAFEKTGNSFVEWNTKADGSGDAYADKATMSAGTTTDGGTVTLYAQWTPSSKTVSFDGNGGSSPDPIPVKIGSAYGHLPTTAREGYTFVGWYTESDGGTLITEESTVTITKDHTLYAHWALNSQTVTFDSNGGEAPNPSTKVVTYNAVYGALPTSSRTGYEFDGWYTTLTGASKVTAETIVTTTNDHFLYAHWYGNSYTVTFDANGGSLTSTGTMTVEYGAKYGTLATATRAGYSFVCWSTSPIGGKSVTSDSTVSTPANHTLYAQWLLEGAYTIDDIDALRDVTGALSSPFATSPSAKAGIVNSPTAILSGVRFGASASSRLTFQNGFTPDFATPLPTGRVITRQMMNAIGNLGSQCQFFEQCGGFYTFDEDVSEAIGGYPKGAFLQFFDEATNELRTVVSLADDNTNNFVADKTLIDGDADVGKWAYVDDNPPVGIEVDYSDYEDLSDTLFVGTGLPDLYEVQFDAYLQLFAIGTLGCESLRRDEAENCQIYFKDSEGNVTYREVNGMYFTEGTGTSFLDIYSNDSQTFGSIVLGGWRPFEWDYWDANNEGKLHLEMICPISPFSCGVMLSKGDKIRIRNSLKSSPLTVVDTQSTTSTSTWPKGAVHERFFDDSVLRRNYLVRFANLYRRGVRV